MDDSSDLKLDLLDELCDKLDKSGIEGNIIERDSHGRPYVNIWYGDFKDHPQRWAIEEKVLHMKIYLKKLKNLNGVVKFKKRIMR